MPLNITSSPKVALPPPRFLTLDSWKKGVISLIDKSKLPLDALDEATNLFLVEDGQPTPRPGVNWYGAVAPNGSAISGFDYFDYSGVIHLVMTAGTAVYRSTDNGTTWNACSGATLTAGHDVNMNQNGSYLYLTNGVDNIVRYDGTTTLAAYTTLAAPGAPSAAETGLATGTAFTYNYKVARVNTVGFSEASVVNTGTISSNLARSSWDATTNFASITTPAAIATQTRWDFYISTDATNYYYLASMPAANGATAVYIDDGSAIPVPGTTAPTGNTTQGPLVEELVNVGGRQYGVRDTANRYKIWFTGGGHDSGSFSTAYNGGSLIWQEGGKFIPMKVADYDPTRKGATPLATVWCKSADGQGCILQMSLDEMTIADVTIIVPSAFRLPGSRGTGAPGSVVSVLNDYIFYNQQAVYSLGPRPQLLNILSTDETSANIRPDVKRISTAAESGIASVYYDAKVYFSVPYGANANNATIVFDTERKAWLPRAFDIGFKKFLRYTDTLGANHLLALKSGDTQLSEISVGIKGDYGQAFTTTLVTGLYPVSKNRFEFQFTEEAEIELSQPVGTINVELVGTERSQGYSTQKTTSITNAISYNTGHDAYLHDTRFHDDTADAPSLYSESSVKRYFAVQKELNAIQWRLTTNSVDANYIARTLQTWGTATETQKPRQWRLT